MSKNGKGYMGEQIGKLGPAVGKIWKGKMIYSAYQKFVHNPHTRSQRLIRARFAKLTEMESVFLPILRIGLGVVADKRAVTEGNKFVDLNWNAVTATSPEEVEVNYGSLVVGKGILPNANFHEPDFETERQVTVAFDSDTVALYAGENDLVYLFAYQPDLRQSRMGKPVRRSAESITMTLPSAWSGMRVHLYSVAVGKSTNTDLETTEVWEKNIGLVSDSVYVGSGDAA